jgi:hypothetical protein
MTESPRTLLLPLLLLAGTACVEILDPLRQPYLQDFLVGPYGNTPSTPQPVVVVAGRRISVSGDFQLPVGDCMAYELEPDVAVPVRSEIQFLIRAIPTGATICEFPSAWVHYEAILGEFEEGTATLTIVHRVRSGPSVMYRTEVELR